MSSLSSSCCFFFFFFFNDPATTEIYTLSLHDAFRSVQLARARFRPGRKRRRLVGVAKRRQLGERSEEHTSELQSHSDLVCRLLLEKKKKKQKNNLHICKHIIIVTIVHRSLKTKRAS